MKRKTMPRALALLMAVAVVCASVITVPSTDAQAAAKLKLTATKQTLYIGAKNGSFTLKTKSKVKGGVKYATSNKAVATVSSKGKVAAKSAGTATITVTSKKNKKAKATCKITVKEGVESIQTASKLTMQKGKSATLNLGFKPSNAVNAKVKEMSFESSKKSVATVDKKGKIKAKKVGTAKITVQPKSKDGSAKKVTVTVKVVKKVTPVNSIKLDKNSLALNVEASDKLTATVSAKKGKPTSKTLYWVSSNTNVATVKNGTVTAVGNGDAKITAYATDNSGKKATCNVHVTTAPSTIILDQPGMEFTVGDAARALTATLAPETVSPELANVIWTSSDAGIVKVTPEMTTLIPGTTVTSTMVEPVAAGTAVITATAGGASAQCVVKVNPAAPTGRVFTLPKAAKSYKLKLSETKEKTVMAASVKADYEYLVNKALNIGSVTVSADSIAKQLNALKTLSEINNFSAIANGDNVNVTAGSRSLNIEVQEEGKIVLTADNKTVEVTNYQTQVSGDKTNTVFTADVKATAGSSTQQRTVKVTVTKTGITVSRVVDGQEKTYMTIADGAEAYTVTVYPDSRDDLGLLNIDYDTVTIEPIME